MILFLFIFPLIVLWIMNGFRQAGIAKIFHEYIPGNAQIYIVSSLQLRASHNA